MPRLAAVVLAGGRASRFGSDKLEAPVGRGRVLDAALRAALVTADGPVVLVGPPRDGLDPRVLVTREHPAGGGPAAALEAGLALVGDAPMVLVLAGDLLAPDGAPAVLVTAAEGHSGAVLVDTEGRRQPLLAAYRVADLRAALATVSAAGRSMHDLLRGLDVVEVPDTGGWSRDVDVPEDLSPRP